MKRFIGILALAIILTVVGQHAVAQNFKFGHINSDELIKAMPDYDSATVKLEKFRKELVNYLEIMQVELNNKAEALTKESKNLNDIVRQNREQELQEMKFLRSEGPLRSYVRGTLKKSSVRTPSTTRFLTGNRP